MIGGPHHHCPVLLADVNKTPLSIISPIYRGCICEHLPVAEAHARGIAPREAPNIMQPPGW